MLLGESSSGKENLIKRYVSGYFNEDGKLTRGVDFSSKTINFKGKVVKIQFWDVADDQRFRFLLSSYCAGSNGALVIFDMANVKTLDRLTEWTQTVRERAEDIPTMLIGNENILGKPREISREEGMKIAEKFNISGYSEISTETGKGIEEMFHNFTALLFEKYKKYKD